MIGKVTTQKVSSLPYLIESKVKKQILPELHTGLKVKLLNNKTFVSEEEDWMAKLNLKIQNLDAFELELLSEAIEDEGWEFGLNYLVGGQRIKSGFCFENQRASTVDSEDIRTDRFMSVNGIQMF